MYYLDSQRTLTRRDSSLISSQKYTQGDDQLDDRGLLSSARGPSVLPRSESGGSVATRPRGSVEKELVTMLFESMLDSIVDSWEVIVQPKYEESTPVMSSGKTASEITLNKKKKNTAKLPKSKRSKNELSDVIQEVDPLQQVWWSSPDERAVIHFKNGNIYEGSISMKCMHGEGRFQWADGTTYLGKFTDNKINGKGIIQWKDDTWYEGDFVGNLRHGRGLYVNSREQQSFAGGWHCGTKHGTGVIYYSNNFKNSYDGEWVHNVRHGFGSREYCQQSGYNGEWDKYVREGRGLMIWSNHDFYRGEWKNGVMSGYGLYIWEAYYNNSMSLPSITAYRGHWAKGKRNGYGVLNLGLGLGSHYKGEFKDNRKHGAGKFVTNNGLILEAKNLFIDDNIGTLQEDQDKSRNSSDQYTRPRLEEPYNFDICDSTVGLLYHVEEAIRNIDRQIDLRENIINEYLKNNKNSVLNVSIAVRKENCSEENIDKIDSKNITDFEEISLRKSLRCYESDLVNIYCKYATICNTEEINFTPILIRLYLWQLYYDCNIHEKGLTLVDIDRAFHRNPEWLSRSPHDPFEKIYFWQFTHSLITVASKLHAKRETPGPKPDTILASAFRTFMEKDVLLNVGRCKGRLVNSFGQFIPLKGLYKLYRQLGDPHTVRQFLCAIRRSTHCTDKPQPPLVEAPDQCLPLGRNVFVFGDEMTFSANEVVSNGSDEEYENEENFKDLPLFNFGNLASKTIIKIFSSIFPQLDENKTIKNLDIEINFFEFFEAFVACAEESMRVKDEEMRWREKFS